MEITLGIIIVTVIVSYMAWNNDALMNKLIFWPKRMDSPNEYQRFVTHGFLHADGTHLFFNMLTLYFFGRIVEVYYAEMGKLFLYPVMYVSAIIVAGLPSYIKHKNDYYYRSLGASGAVAAVLFSTVFLAPWYTISVFFIPMPAIIFAVLYLAYSIYMSRRGGDNIGHDAHFFGAIYGFAFAWAFSPDHGAYFLEQLMHPVFNLR